MPDTVRNSHHLPDDSLPDEPLANPYWAALSTEQASLALGGPLAKRFPADVIPFAGIANPGPDALAALHALLAPGESIFLTSPTPLVHPGLKQLLQLPGLQMLHALGSTVAPHPSSEGIEPLGPADIPQMLALKAVAFPGYFGPRAATLGSFFGVRVQGMLVAMAGERLALPGLSEVSAVCTHPEHLGKGYAAALIQHLLRTHAARNVQSFLGVVTANTRAIALYRRLGFTVTRELLWHQLQRVE